MMMMGSGQWFFGRGVEHCHAGCGIQLQDIMVGPYA
jgi:arginine utilization protein RocB